MTLFGFVILFDDWLSCLLLICLCWVLLVVFSYVWVLLFVGFDLGLLCYVVCWLMFCDCGFELLVLFVWFVCFVGVVCFG